ncbi:thioesterase [Robertkochia marina]|uniref:Thioesterase n=1 Tax=Robertkochia marina TaxID=1227945 RepID=A0A4S3M352_9FLAO|nr:thioesterase family protein [Robertkochia marina]THD69493.1 thioesterase [Robertkochia marina]TRZ47248.1 thioesterase [Robertkochia marina]
MYFKEFEIRWNDLDANRHLANKAYIEFAAHTRMSFLLERGFDHSLLDKLNIGPVVFFEHIYYFKEVFAGKPVKVSLELSGLSEDGMFFEFRHNYYDYKGRNVAHCEIMGAWIDLETRKLIGLPEEVRAFLKESDRSDEFRVLTKEDTRKHQKRPVNIEL